jgi:hypothetical protein
MRGKISSYGLVLLVLGLVMLLTPTQYSTWLQSLNIEFSFYAVGLVLSVIGLAAFIAGLVLKGETGLPHEDLITCKFCGFSTERGEAFCPRCRRALR